MPWICTCHGEETRWHGRYSKLDVLQANKLWNYMQMGHTIEKADVILVCGSNDTRTAEFATQMYRDGLADWLLFSGNEGLLTKGKWTQPEAKVFEEVAVGLGVPKEVIIVEPRATNTGENMLYSHRALERAGLTPTSIILVHTPYMERRTYATFMKQYPGADNMRASVTSPKMTLEEYPNEDVGSLDDVIDVLIRCLTRIKDYPQMGFQIHQEIPDNVWKAYRHLLKKNQDSHTLMQLRLCCRPT
ncbi:uncharacterized protein SCO4629-like isoform X2 [Gigantopelta aegis]|nr:uncharacterized protein SCO4629-like isoform X2 [Gigantopelta aegis]